MAMYAQWYHGQGVARRAMFAGLCQEHGGGAMDGSLDSLVLLEGALSSILASSALGVLRANDGELSDAYLSLAFDVGYYCGEVAVANGKGVRWGQCIKGKRDVNYGHVVVIGCDGLPCNPYRMASNALESAADGEGMQLLRYVRAWMQV